MPKKSSVAAAIGALEDGYFAPIIDHIAQDCKWRDHTTPFFWRDRNRSCHGIDFVREAISASLGALAQLEHGEVVLQRSEQRAFLVRVTDTESGSGTSVVCRVGDAGITRITTTPSTLHARIVFEYDARRLKPTTLNASRS